MFLLLILLSTPQYRPMKKHRPTFSMNLRSISIRAIRKVGALCVLIPQVALSQDIAQDHLRGNDRSELLTLSDGRYPEIIMHDTLRMVGPFGYSSVTGRAYFHEKEVRSPGPVHGRWLTMDPHAYKYRSWSPYAFAINSPLMVMDGDGRDTLLVHLKRVASDHGEVVLFKVDFTLIQKGVWTNVEMGVTSAGTTEFYMLADAPTWTAGNTLDKKSFFDIRFQRMASKKETPGWENTILLRPSSGGADRGQFAHPGNGPGDVAGCLAPCSGEFKVIHRPGDPDMQVAPHDELYEKQPGGIGYSKELLAGMRALYDQLKAGNSTPGEFGFQLTTTRDQAVERMEPRKIDLGLLRTATTREPLAPKER